MEVKSNRITIFLIILVITLLSLTACGKEQSARMVNEQSFSLEGINEVIISYDDENISFFVSENENLIVREYMSEDKKSYYGRVNQGKDSIQISEGGKPFFKGGFVRYVEVYLPESYSKNLKATTTNGNIDMSDMELDLGAVRIDCTSGQLELKKAVAEEIYLSTTSGSFVLGSLSGDQIRIETTQGEVSCENADGNVIYTSTSGNAEFKSVTGAGRYKAENSGKLSVIYDEVTGDLSFFNKNDDVEVQLPKGLSFEFEAVTKNGSINTDFQGEISSNGDVTSGTVGSNPKVTVKVETKNGNIEVSR